MCDDQLAQALRNVIRASRAEIKRWESLVPLVTRIDELQAEVTQLRQDSNTNYLRAEEYDQALVAARGQIGRMKVALVKVGITEW